MVPPVSAPRATHAFISVLITIAWLAATGGPSSASCAAPSVSVTPRTVSAGDRLVVARSGWITTCNDTPGGCERAPTDPYLDITVTIRPADGSGPDITLGPVDAIDDEFTFHVETTVPDLPPGRYTVIARAARPRYEATPVTLVVT